MNVVYITAAQITRLQNDVSRLETEKHQMERLHIYRKGEADEEPIRGSCKEPADSEDGSRQTENSGEKISWQQMSSFEIEAS